MAVILANTTTTEFVHPKDLYQNFQTKRVDPDNETKKYINLACGIIQQAVEDWQYLQFGQLDKATYLTAVIRYDEILNFFHSEWFEFLLSYALPDVTPDDVRTALKIKNRKDLTWR